MPLSPLAIEQITNILTREGNTWQGLQDYITNNKIVPAVPTPAPKPETSDVDAAFVHATCEAIINSKCKLTRGGKEFVIQLRERASNYPTVRFSPKQWSWFSSIMADAGVSETADWAERHSNPQE